MSVLDKNVSYYPNVKSVNSGVTVNLLSILESSKHKDIISKLRNSDIEVREEIKSNLPCYTVAGVFNSRKIEGLSLLSGLACVDLDSAENYDCIHLLNELKKIDSIAYAGLSCSGKRIYCIVPFKYPEKYQEQYERLIKSFEDMGLPMGDCCHKQISQPRFISFNDSNTQFFNHKARSYALLPTKKTISFPHREKYLKSNLNSNEMMFRWCIEQINKSHVFIKGNRHNYMIYLARYCNLKGLSENFVLNSSQIFSDSEFTSEEINSIVTSIYKKHSNSHSLYPFKKEMK